MSDLSRPFAVLARPYVVLAAAFVLSASACQRANPAYHPDDAAVAGGRGSGGRPGNGGNGGTSGGAGGVVATTGGTMGGGGTTTSTGGTATGGVIGGGGAAGQIPDGGTPDAGSTDGGRVDGPDASTGMCEDGGDCQGKLGAPPCGTWECRSGMCALVCPNCTDGDGDGYGVGAGCAGLDCDDADPQVTSAASRSCFTGPAASKNVGVCRAGVETCVAGAWWAACNGQVLPSGEACNGEDDDCNGTPDDKLGSSSCGVGACAHQVSACASGKAGACLATAPAATTDGCDGVDNDCDGVIDEDCSTVACVHVAPSGDDTGADGSTIPFRSLQPAIAWAAMPDHPRRLCVAGGTTCQDRATYTSPGSSPGVTMANGVSVFGNYESTGWTRCPLPAPPTTATAPNVTLQTQTAVGVLFPAAVTSPTTLDGFSITRTRGDTLASTAAVTVDGAKQVTLSDLVITDAAVAVATWGVNLINGAQALITRSTIAGGAGTTDSIAIRSVGATPTIRENCGKLDATTGRCAVTSCLAGGLSGRETSGGSAVTGQSSVIFLKDSPGAIVERNAICGGPATELAGVRVGGQAAGTVLRGNSILALGGATEADGVWLDACGDATPWIVDNELISADGPAGASVAAVRAIGACHPVIDTNQRLLAGGDGANTRATGVLCGGPSGGASRCAVLGNKLIQGATSNHPLLSVGIACEAGACVRIAGNVVTGNNGADTVGVAVAGGGAFIERNTIVGGCGTKTTIGLRLDNGSGRVENNIVRGAVCDTNQAGPTSAQGLRVYVQQAGNEVDVHSNTIDAAGAGACTGAAVAFGTTSPLPGVAAPQVNKGIFRNNVLGAGACKIARYDFWEDAPPARPRILENNDLDPTGTPTALLLEDNATPRNTEAAINALSGTMSSGNISAAPMFVAPPGDLHLSPGSACVNAGTAGGAPAQDFAGKLRDAKPDIGAFEQ